MIAKEVGQERVKRLHKATQQGAKKAHREHFLSGTAKMRNWINKSLYRRTKKNLNDYVQEGNYGRSF